MYLPNTARDTLIAPGSAADISPRPNNPKHSSQHLPCLDVNDG